MMAPRIWLGRLAALFTWLIRWPLRLWMGILVTPGELSELKLDPDQPLCYLLPSGSVSDWLALEAACARHGLPRPQLSHNRLPTPQRAIVIGLPAPGEPPRAELRRMVERGLREPGYAVQILPVSVFWGRDPSNETSLLRILFTDSVRPGRLRKALIILAQGRNILVNMGQPLDYRAVIAGDENPDHGARKLKRVLREHFRRQRAATLGPPWSQRTQIINALLAEPAVQAAIERTARAEDIPLASARQRARGYADEIAADYSKIAIGFMLRMLRWLWHRIYDGIEVRHLQRLRGTAQQTALVFLPAHRSHMDYLLASYVLYVEGFALPQIAAGINLNFWPVGGLLRRCGAFYLRRSFGGDKLYTAVFRGYVDALIGRGQSVEFFPEGGRSRTGRLLEPRTGLLSMIVESHLRHRDLPVAIVPVYIGYDRVMEVNSYFDELRGGGKKKEGMTDLLRSSARILRRKYGRAYLSFGEPIHLAEFAARHGASSDGSPDSATLVDALAHETMCRINASAVPSSTALVALVLLGSPQKAVLESEMINTLGLFARLLTDCPYSPDSELTTTDGGAMLAEAEPLARLERIPHAWGDVLTVDPRQAVLLTYARNSAMHLLALPSLIANFFSHAAQRPRAMVLEQSRRLYPLLASELFLRWGDDAIADVLESVLAALVAQGLLQPDGPDTLSRPAAGTAEFSALISLARITRESLERYSMTTVLLARDRVDDGHIPRAAFERQCQLMAERMAILTGRNSPEFFDLRLFRNHLQIMQRLGLLHIDGADIRIEPVIDEFAEYSLRLLGPDIKQSILHLTGKPDIGPTTDPAATDTETEASPRAPD